MINFLIFLLVLNSLVAWFEINGEIITITSSSDNKLHVIETNELFTLGMIDDNSIQTKIKETCQLIDADEEECIRYLTCQLYTLDGRITTQCKETYSDDMKDNQLFEGNQGYTTPKYRYSSFTCLSGSQKIDKSILRTSNVRKKFQTSDPSFRVCKYHNVCLLYGSYPTMVYFEDPKVKAELPSDFQLSSFDVEDHVELGYISDYYTSLNKSFLPIHFQSTPMPNSMFLHSDKYRVGFLLSHSWPNYGHHLMDSIFPTLTAAQIYQIPFENIQQVYDSSCLRMANSNALSVNPKISNKTNQEVCLDNIHQLNDYFFDHSPLFLDDETYSQQRICYRTLITGFGSAFSLKAWDLSKQLSMHVIRNHVLTRLTTKQRLNTPGYFEKYPDNRILVLQSGHGFTLDASDRVLVNDFLCQETSQTLVQMQLQDVYQVQCIYPQDLTFEEEIQYAQSAAIIVSFHGTLSYTTIFARDNTQVVIITQNQTNEFGKEYHVFSRLTYLHVLWLTVTRLQTDFHAIVKHAIRLKEIHD